MLKIVQLFPVPRPAMISVPMELTPSEIKQKIQLKAPTFPVFNFIHQLQDLLDAKEFCHLGNLSINAKDRWAPFVSVHPNLPNSEIQSGSWFQNIVNDSDVEPYEFIIGLQLNVDKTGAIGDAFQRHSSEPLMFTTTLLNEDCRRKPHLWKCLGFLPSPEKKKNDNGRHVRYYHAALDAMLVSIEKAQKDPPLIRVRLGNEFRYCIARILMVNFICDGLANEVLTGRRQSRTDQTCRLNWLVL